MKSWPRRGEARQVQDLLRERVRVEPLPIGNVHRVAGVDASYQGKSVCASVVVLEFPELQTIEQAVVEVPITFPYVPGLLSFREGPAILAAVEKLSKLPDVLIVDGHGQAHPRHFGLACHLGVLLDLPAIGCAKSILIGNVAPLESLIGSTANITLDDQVLGVALRTKASVYLHRTSGGPGFRSPNHLSLWKGFPLTRTCSPGTFPGS